MSLLDSKLLLSVRHLTGTAATVLSCCHLQKKQSPHKIAKGTTEEEFEDNMATVSALAHTQWPDPDKPPLFCYDNASIQGRANYQRMGFSYHQRVRIPVKSPDFNKPIEHVFHQIKDKLRERLYENILPVDGQLVQQWVRDIWQNEITARSIAKDVASLDKTYLAVSTPKGQYTHHPDGTLVEGSGGDFPAAPLC